MLKISALYLDKQKSFVPKKICSMLVIETLKCKISDFLNSNMCFCCAFKVFRYLAEKTVFVMSSVGCLLKII